MKLRTLLLPILLSNFVVADNLVADINDYKKDRALGEMINTSPYRDNPQNKNIQNQLKTRNSPLDTQENKEIINKEGTQQNSTQNKNQSSKKEEENGARFKYKFVIENKKTDGSNLTLKDLKIDEKMLNEAIIDLKQSELSVKSLQELTDVVAFYLQYLGYPTATAYIPQQEINDTITINILFGKLGDYVVNNKSNHLKDFAITHKLNDTLKGKIPTTKDIEDVIYKVNENSGIITGGALQPGKNFGETDVVINVEDDTKATAMLYADNYGIKSTGQIRIGASATFNNVLGMGDTLNTMVQRSDKDQTNYGVSYDTFWGNLRITPKINRSNYSLGGDFKELNAYGSSLEYGVDVKYPFFINAQNSLYAVAGYSRKKLEDSYFDDLVLNLKHSNVFNAGWEGVYRGIENNTLSYSIKVYHGSVYPNNEMSKGFYSLGKFTKMNAYLNNTYVFNDKLSLIVNANMQKVLFNYELDSSEQGTLGGPYGVRAYVSGEGDGDNVVYGMIGLRYASPIPNLYITPFYEAGYSWMEDREYYDEYFLDAWGLELMYMHKNFYVKADFARAFTKYKYDGENRARAYVSAGIYF
ncbi:ShlB/FhaC/HecB family hemolysin secretion/activation protein [Helicobacter burdigaliensis]|uniref:ShlB/FhaC/HecB family hemolysin secretion/activation protein n=1 Tax=Helicobacter burdigaliensis TaxID=2315334 RepID=UPI000EF72938|nr:ShlB/FhaC/HecB family hemolysin secretion/activation protein [Helicobacter burdigaliensis]